ncbi:HdeA/HdeB family chaperone [Methylocella sp.]|uniref:HdeA/HdeB family chaperone n=1 Tax=Methylocella sp. TaxID=1978226 RepID=UPI003785126C
MKSGNALLTSALAGLSMCAGALYAPVAQAQITYDVTKVTCEDYLAMPPQVSHDFSAWMSGWFNQKSNNAVINFDGFAQNVENVKKWCGTNPKASVFDGLTRAAANAKQGVGGPLDVDMSLITCRQFKDLDDDRRSTAQSWLSGYFNGGKNITKIDPRYVERNTKVVTKYCLSHMNAKLMTVIEKKAK